AVRRPACVRDAGGCDRAHLACAGFEVGAAADRTNAFERAVQDRDARGVVASVPELAQAPDEDRYDVALGARPDDSTHVADCSIAPTRPGGTEGRPTRSPRGFSVIRPRSSSGRAASTFRR